MNYDRLRFVIVVLNRRHQFSDTGDTMEMIYNDITNSHPSENVTVTVEVNNLLIVVKISQM